MRYEESEAIEDLGYWAAFGEWSTAFGVSNRRAIRAALWLMLRRENPAVEFDSLNPLISELDIDYSPDDLARWRQSIEDAPDLSDDQRIVLLAEVEQREREVAKRAGGKDPPASDAKDTDLP